MLKTKSFVQIVKGNIFYNFHYKVDLFGVCRYNQDATGTLLISSFSD